MTPPRRVYEASDPDAPLDAIERVLVEMWADIVTDRIRAKLAAEQRRDEDNRASRRPEHTPTRQEAACVEPDN